MDKRKEIEEIAEIINKRVDTNLDQIHGTKSGYGKRADVTTTVGTRLVAEALVNAGYGDVKQAVREFAEKLKSLPQFEEIYPDEQVFISDLKSAIDELVKEVCGE